MVDGFLHERAHEHTEHDDRNIIRDNIHFEEFGPAVDPAAGAVFLRRPEGHIQWCCMLRLLREAGREDARRDLPLWEPPAADADADDRHAERPVRDHVCRGGLG